MDNLFEVLLTVILYVAIITASFFVGFLVGSKKPHSKFISRRVSLILLFTTIALLIIRVYFHR